jgi:hypothetical protein
MSTDKVQPESDEDPESGPQRYKRLPARIRLEDTVETKDTRVPPDPDGGRDNLDYVIRHSDG